MDTGASELVVTGVGESRFGAMLDAKNQAALYYGDDNFSLIRTYPADSDVCRTVSDAGKVVLITVEFHVKCLFTAIPGTQSRH